MLALALGLMALVALANVEGGGSLRIWITCVMDHLPARKSLHKKKPAELPESDR